MTPHAREIAKVVCEKHGVTLDRIAGAGRRKVISMARSELFYRLHWDAGLSYQQIGDWLNRDQATVRYLIDRHKVYAAEFRAELDYRSRIASFYKEAERRRVEARSKPKAKHHVEKQRKCLMCQGEFTSSHFGERVCQPCKGSAAWRDGGQDLQLEAAE